MSYRLTFRPRAERDLRGPLRGLRRLCLGEYRLAYEVDSPAGVLRVHAIAHRRHFYQELIRRM